MQKKYVCELDADAVARFSVMANNEDEAGELFQEFIDSDDFFRILRLKCEFAAPSIAVIYEEKGDSEATDISKHTFYYSHDYPDDTKMTVSIREDGATQLVLSFTSEDPDMGTEEMIYAGNEHYRTLVAELLEELSGHLDRVEFFKREGEWTKKDDYYDEYSRTALYAFEGLLKEVAAQ